MPSGALQNLALRAMHLTSKPKLIFMRLMPPDSRLIPQLLPDDPSRFLFTSESVGEGHPDKLCDQISDAILDACLAQDPYSKVACETAVKGERVFLLGEITTKAKVDYAQIARRVIQRVGYDHDSKGIDFAKCGVEICIDSQSPEIAHSVIRDHLVDTGAGDQGIMFGYATDETPPLMPLSISLAHNLMIKLTELRKQNALPWLRPDAKCQVTVQYRKDNGAMVPERVHTVVLSTQHSAEIHTKDLREELLVKVIRMVIPPNLIDDNTIYHIQPSGNFLIGGPAADAGLTGRKIIVDTYGGWGAHGGGAFSGKDWTKVDRSAAYAARWIAKSIVAAGFARRCLIQLSYSIGLAAPISIYVDSYRTGKYDDSTLTKIVNHNFDLRPGSIVRDLDLMNPIYERTACFGHFGRPEFTWEQPKKLDLPPCLTDGLQNGTDQ